MSGDDEFRVPRWGWITAFAFLCVFPFAKQYFATNLLEKLAFGFVFIGFGVGWAMVVHDQKKKGLARDAKRAPSFSEPSPSDEHPLDG